MNPRSKNLRYYHLKTAALLVCGFFVFTFSNLSSAQSNAAPPAKANRMLYGLASYYAQKFEGRQTANGEIFRHSQLTAACNVLPLGTYIRVTNLKNGKEVVVRTNDRLHPKTRRIIDLTNSAAARLGFVKAGLTRVKIEILGKNYKGSK